MDLQPIIQAVDSLKVILGPLPSAPSVSALPKLEDYLNSAIVLKQLAYLRSVMEKAASYATQYYNLLDRQQGAHTLALKKLVGEVASGKVEPAKKGQGAQGTQGAQSGLYTSGLYSAHCAQGVNSAQTSTQAITHTQHKLIMCEITPGISIPAIVVQSFAQVMQTGELYYIPQCDHFAIKINGKLFHGNVGTIYCSDRSLERVKECRFANCTNDPCDFYHDPCKHSGKKDRRNFVANSWTFIPAESRRTGDIRGRKLGNKESLAADLAQCTVEEGSKFKDQVFHDLLCALLLP